MTFRQVLSQSEIKHGRGFVHPNRYIITKNTRVQELRVILGTCSSLIGYKNGIAFVSHIFMPDSGLELLKELESTIIARTALKLQEFQLTISGGNGKELGLEIGKRNINLIKEYVGEQIVDSIHVNQPHGNQITLEVGTGKIKNKVLGNL